MHDDISTFSAFNAARSSEIGDLELRYVPACCCDDVDDDLDDDADDDAGDLVGCCFEDA